MENQGVVVVEAPPSRKFYNDTLLQGSSRLHAGDVYGNIVHSNSIRCGFPAVRVEC
jgi:hypothetical protein